MNKITVKYASLPFMVLFAIALGSCGKIGNLEPKAGSQPIPTAYGSDKPAAADTLATPNAQARPGRSVELLRRSERREDDPFELPPGKEPALTDGVPDGSAKAAPVNPTDQPEF
jgi:hypothetical protein